MFGEVIQPDSAAMTWDGERAHYWVVVRNIDIPAGAEVKWRSCEVMRDVFLDVLALKRALDFIDLEQIEDALNRIAVAIRPDVD
jgi:hypothetical protein